MPSGEKLWVENLSGILILGLPYKRFNVTQYTNMANFSHTTTHKRIDRQSTANLADHVECLIKNLIKNEIRCTYN